MPLGPGGSGRRVAAAVDQVERVYTTKDEWLREAMLTAFSTASAAAPSSSTAAKTKHRVPVIT